MRKPHPPRVLAFATGETLDLIREALGELMAMAYCVDVPRLRRDYGNDVADEVVRKLVAESVRPQRRVASRKSR